MARPPRARAARARTFPTWTWNELGAFLEAVSGHEHAALWHVAALTGMRRGELVALRWEDVDLETGTITVCRSVGTGLDGVHDKEPKSDAGRRTEEYLQSPDMTRLTPRLLKESFGGGTLVKVLTLLRHSCAELSGRPLGSRYFPAAASRARLRARTFT